MTKYIGFFRGNEDKVEQIVKGQHSDQPRKVIRETHFKRQTLINFLEEADKSKEDPQLAGFVERAKMDNLHQFIEFLDNDMVPSGKTMVVETIKDVVGHRAEVLEGYRAIWKRKIKCVFLDSEWLNTEFMWENKTPLNTALKIVKATVDTMNNHSLALEKAKKDVRQELIKTGEQKFNYNKGKTLVTSKQKRSLAYIRKNSKTFDGKESDEKIMKTIGISHNTLYKYKRIIKEEMDSNK